MFCIKTHDLVKVLQKHHHNMLLDEGNMKHIIEAFGSEWFIVDGEWEEVNPPRNNIDNVETWGFLNSSAITITMKEEKV